MTRSNQEGIASLIARLSMAGLAQRTRVFGSVMKGDPAAADLDCVIDLHDPIFSGVVHVPPPVTAIAHLLASTPASVQEALSICLVLRRHPDLQSSSGVPLLNCFVRLGGVVIEPTRSSTWWQISREGQSIWGKALTRGVSLSSLTWPPASPSMRP